MASPLKRNRFASETIHVSEVASDERHYELDDPFFEGIPDDKSQLSSHMPYATLMPAYKTARGDDYFLSPFRNRTEDYTDT
jgi:hypothetical protein